MEKAEPVRTYKTQTERVFSRPVSYPVILFERSMSESTSLTCVASAPDLEMRRDESICTPFTSGPCIYISDLTENMFALSAMQRTSEETQSIQDDAMKLCIRLRNGLTLV